MNDSVWCVKHNSGWCATKSGKEMQDADFSIPTLCGYFISLPIGSRKGEPTCFECLDILESKRQKAG